MHKVIIFVLILYVFVFSDSYSDSAASGCSFLSETPKITFPNDLKNIRIGNYYRIFYPPDDRMFQDSDRNGVPEILEKQVAIFDKARHFIQIQLGWKLPVTRMEMNRPELHIAFISTDGRFLGTVLPLDGQRIVFDKSVLLSNDFPAILIHQIAHAVELQYKQADQLCGPEERRNCTRDYWFFEATAGWMEGQFHGYSRAAVTAQLLRMNHPEISITDPSPSYALGASRFLDLLARPYQDVIRQVWDQWSENEDVIETVKKVLTLNHLPDFESYLQNYFLLSTPGRRLESDSRTVVLRPFSASVFHSVSDQKTGGIHLVFVPEAEASYSASLLFHVLGEKSGTLAMRRNLAEPWHVTIPYGSLDHYRFVIVNHSSRELHGTVQKTFDSTIPAVLEYFRANAGEGGVQLEWKTAKENGVAFWNLYRIRGGKKERLNDFPIPATISSEEGVHYLFLDSSESAFYSLEAITSEGFPSPLADIEISQ